MKLLKKWDKEIANERSNEKERTSQRTAKNLQEEYNFNFKNVCKQLGRTVGFQIYGGGTIYNIDKYVMDATIARKSATITDPETGKTAEITYNPFSFKVEKPENYIKFFSYLFPSQLNSYQRIAGKNGLFNYPLNGDIQYDLAIIGVTDKGYFYKEIQEIESGDKGIISLTEITEKELNSKIKNLNESRGVLEGRAISSDISWLKKEQKDYMEQNEEKKTNNLSK